MSTGSADKTFHESTFGNGLGYASDDGSTNADSPQILKDMTLPSNTEVSIFADKKCEGDACGFYRPGIVAHRTSQSQTYPSRPLERITKSAVNVFGRDDY